MLFHLIAMFTAGAGAAGIVLALNALSGRRLPRWLMPFAAGAAMLAFTLWSEYSWYPRTAAALGPEVAVALAPADRQVYRPWSYVFPLVTRLVAVDLRAAPDKAAGGGPFLANALVLQRWMPTRTVPMAFDCAGGRMSEFADGATLAADGTLEGASWKAAGADDPLWAAVCGRG